MKKTKLPLEILKLLNKITNKRAKIVIDHILKYGSITTEDLEKKYGYNHPPRAIRDVREAGIPIETFRVKSSDGRNIAAYKFGDLSKIKKDRLKGRILIPKNFKDELLKRNNNECNICRHQFAGRYLQVDHKVPYEILGDNSSIKRNIEDYMLLCGTCNRAKSWSCEHCDNWKDIKDINLCKTCYWGAPQEYSHIANKEIRRLDLTWEENEVLVYDYFKKKAERHNSKLPLFIKNILYKAFKNSR